MDSVPIPTERAEVRGVGGLALLTLLALVLIAWVLYKGTLKLSSQIPCGSSSRPSSSPRGDLERGPGPISTDSDGECPICLEKKSSENMVYTSCQHVFCESCLINTWKTHRSFPSMVACPMCRASVSTIFPMAASVSRDVAEYNAVAVTRASSSRDASVVERAQGGCMAICFFICESPLLLRSFLTFLVQAPRLAIPLLCYAVRSIRFISMAIGTWIYCALPVDFLPEQTLGYLGFVDDGLVQLCLLLAFLHYFRRIVLSSSSSSVAV